MMLFHVRNAVTLFFFLNFLVYLSEGENSKYGTRITSTAGSTTGMNTDMPLILNNNLAIGVIDEVREITWFYKQG
jgi:hypothetical protein